MEPRVISSTNEILSATNNDVLPALKKSNVIYQFSCHCDSQYVGRTSKRLQGRIKQDVPKSIRSCSSSQKLILAARQRKSSTQTNSQSLASDSALDFIFYKILSMLNVIMTVDFFCHGRSSFHLVALKATFIKTSNPALCQ